MRVQYAAEFQKQLDKLSSGIRLQFLKQDGLFRTNWRDPRLHVKKLKEYKLTFSFRVTRQYRVLFIFVSPSEVLFATIAHRKDSYR